MSISQLARSISQSPTLKLNETAAMLRDKGEPVIHLGGGEPKSKAPINAIINSAALLNSGDVKYTPADGIPALKKAIVRYTEEYYNKLVAADQIMASNGAKQALMTLLYAILNPKDEVVFPAPYWVSYGEMVKLAGGVPVPVAPSDGSFRPTMEDITEVVGSYTKAIIINSPSNPTGVLYSAGFIAEVVAYCEKKKLYLIMDDIYNRLVFDGKTAPNCYEYAKDDTASSRLVVIQGVSKMYAMTGFRIGWAIGNKNLIEAMTNIQSHQSSGPATPSQWAAVGALTGVQSSVESMRLTLENHRNVMVERLRAIPGLQVTKPDGTFYCFPDFRAYEKDSAKLAGFLLEKVRVVAVPGKEFGLDGHLRLSFCGTIKEITEGIERIQWALDPNSANELYLGERKLVRDWL
ncbi:MAG: pyridoxal phosphate-dependent aminotransferase [Acidobacteria bacterium]|jgi:aspartate aminotransferase|nr:pyridoxal phosphate-dependent aminotransferase [Acidobacteriota bacterium]